VPLLTRHPEIAAPTFTLKACRSQQPTAAGNGLRSRRRTVLQPGTGESKKVLLSWATILGATRVTVLFGVDRAGCRSATASAARN